MHLRGRHCDLRPWRIDDAAPLVRHANNINVARHLRDRFPHPYTIDDAYGFLRFAASASTPSNFAIEVDGEAVGGLGYVPGTDVERFAAEVGYWLGESLWGRGIVTEALVTFTDYAFRDLQLLRLFALPLVDNVGSTRVLEKAGYVLEGRLHSSCVKYGEPRDQAIYARINPNWTMPR